MNAAAGHDIAWVSAGPLWASTVKTPDVMRRPTLLGFGHDDFMDEVLATLAAKPEGLAARVATGASRSFRARLPGEPYDAQPLTEQQSLKLYQPVHGWFYLVAGSLVCRLPGLPDHAVDVGAGEKAGFVVRRLDGKNELALVTDASGRKMWQATSRPDVLAAGEDVLPLFPLGYLEVDRRRKLLAGVIPAGSQELLQGTPVGSAAPADDEKPGPADAFEDVRGRVIQAITLLQTASPAPPDDVAREQSRFALLDLADFLTFYVPSVMDALRQGSSLAGPAGALLALLRGRKVDPTVDGTTLADVLRTILALPLTAPFGFNLRNADASLPAALETALEAALEAATGTTLSDVPVDDQNASATLFVTRLSYERPQCVPFHGPVMSGPSEPFTIAPYFDPDAPSRPIRIAIPFDPSVKGLRRFRKNVKMILSDGLRQAMNRKMIKGDIDGPNVDCGGLELSIPIITIVAMIILFVFINLLNLVFFWLPFVKICLPKVKVEL